MKKAQLEPIPDRTRRELSDHDFEITEVVPLVGLRCAHGVGDVRIVAKGKVGLMVRCRCGYSGLFVPVPRRPLKSDETDLMVKLAREAAWPELS